MTATTYVCPKKVFCCRHKDCKFQIALHFSRPDNIKVLKVAGVDHHHVGAVKFSLRVVEKVLGPNWYDMGCEDAVRALRLAGVAVRDGRPLYSLRSRHRNALPSITRLSELQTWAAANSIEDFTQPDRTFAVAHHVDAREGSQLIRVFLSTSRLLANASNGKSVLVDATFKMVSIYFPVIVVGTVDATGQFHPIGVMLSSEESGDAYSYALDVVFRANPAHRFDHLMGDLSPAITDAFNRMHGERKIGSRKFCYFHIIKSAEEWVRRHAAGLTREQQIDKTRELKTVFYAAYHAKSREEACYLFSKYIGNPVL